MSEMYERKSGFMGRFQFRSATGEHPPPGLRNHAIEQHAQEDMQTKSETQQLEPFKSLLRNDHSFYNL